MRKYPAGAKARKIDKWYHKDNKDRLERIGQQDAFRNFFYRLVINKSFQPAVCVRCLAPDAEVWQAKKMRVCEDCMSAVAADEKMSWPGEDTSSYSWCD